MIKDQEGWDRMTKAISDPYGKACIDTAREVMRVLDEGGEIDCHDMICKADKKFEAGGLTGFMAGAVADMVSHFHSRGDEFRIKWNANYGIPAEEKRVVNPAILSIEDSN